MLLEIEAAHKHHEPPLAASEEKMTPTFKTEDFHKDVDVEGR